MSFNLHKRSLLDLVDFSPRDIRYLLDLAAELKRSRAVGNEHQRLKGKNVALIFEKISTRTRCAFEVAVHVQGGHVTYLDSAGLQLGHKESLKDTARVLGRMFDGIEYRGFHQSVVQEIAKFPHVPVWKCLTDEAHPTQVLANLLTMQESGEKPLHGLSFCYLDDARALICKGAVEEVPAACTHVRTPDPVDASVDGERTMPTLPLDAALLARTR